MSGTMGSAVVTTSLILSVVMHGVAMASERWARTLGGSSNEGFEAAGFKQFPFSVGRPRAAILSLPPRHGPMSASAWSGVYEAHEPSPKR